MSIDVRLTEEMQEKLKNVIGFDVNSEFKYTFKAYRENNIPKDLWPVFVLKSLDGLQIARQEDAIGYSTLDHDQVRLHFTHGSQRISTLETGLVSFKNYMLEDGSFISYDGKNIITSDGKVITAGASVQNAIRFLKPSAQTELVEAINNHSVLTEEELRGLE